MAHPLIEIMLRRYDGCVLSYSDMELALWIPSRRDNRERLLVYFECLGDRRDQVRVSFQAKTRYPVTQARHALYLKALSGVLADWGFSLESHPPCTIELWMNLSRTSFGPARRWDNSVDNVVYFVHRSLGILSAATLVTHLNYRLPDRGGTDAYRKLSPSRLAALTACGSYDGASMH